MIRDYERNQATASPTHNLHDSKPAPIQPSRPADPESDTRVSPGTTTFRPR
jgi:hypothetical protein